MPISYTTTYVCDRCGRKSTKHGYPDYDYPEGWTVVQVEWEKARLFCNECSKKHWIIAVLPDVITDKHCGVDGLWEINDEQIKSLAAGVPAEDIFV